MKLYFTLFTSLIINIIFCLSCFSQTLQVFDVDSTDYPIMKAKFYAWDAYGKQITDIAKSDFLINENGQNCNVLSVDCPSGHSPEPISLVMSHDLSLSMGWWKPDALMLSKITSETIVNSITSPYSEYNVQACEDIPVYFGFSEDKSKIINQIEGLLWCHEGPCKDKNDFKAGFYSQVFNNKDLISGCYSLVLRFGSQVISKPIIVDK